MLGGIQAGQFWMQQDRDVTAVATDGSSEATLC
jgi:hypothetical protein